MNWIQQNILAELGFYVSSNGIYASRGTFTQVWFERAFKNYSVYHNGKKYVCDTFEDVTRIFYNEK